MSARHHKRMRREGRALALAEPSIQSEQVPLPRRLATELAGMALIMFVGIGFTALAPPDTLTRLGPFGLGIVWGSAAALALYLFRSSSGFNPAAVVGLALLGHERPKRALCVVCCHLLGGWIGTGLVALIATSKPGFDLALNGLSASGYAEHSPQGFGLRAVVLTEAVSAAVALGLALRWNLTQALRERSAPTALIFGLAIALTSAIGSSVSGGWGNPVRSVGPAVILGGWAWHQLWVFCVVPLVSTAAIAAALCLFGPWRNAGNTTAQQGGSSVGPPDIPVSHSLAPKVLPRAMASFALVWMSTCTHHPMPAGDAEGQARQSADDAAAAVKASEQQALRASEAYQHRELHRSEP